MRQRTVWEEVVAGILLILFGVVAVARSALGTRTRRSKRSRAEPPRIDPTPYDDRQSRSGRIEMHAPGRR